MCVCTRAACLLNDLLFSSVGRSIVCWPNCETGALAGPVRTTRRAKGGLGALGWAVCKCSPPHSSLPPFTSPPRTVPTVTRAWHLHPPPAGKCVPFDWMAFVAMLVHGRRDAGQGSAMTVGQRELWVGVDDPSVLVLRDPSE